MTSAHRTGKHASRGSARWQSLLALALPVLLVVATIGPALLGLYTLLSVSLLTRRMPWRVFSGNDSVDKQFCSGDTIDFFLPGISHVREQVFAGTLPVWQGLVSGGSAIGTTPDLGLLNPLAMPYWLLPLSLAPAFVKLLELVVGMGGMFLFLRRLGVSRLAASTAGVVFVTTGFMVVWSDWPQTRTAALIPALFWAAERLLQRPRPQEAVLLAATIAALVLGGFPAVAGFAIYLLGGYVLVRTLLQHGGAWRQIAQRIGLAAGALVLGLALAAVQFLPFVATMLDRDLSTRAGLASVQLPDQGLVTLVAPEAFGLCINGINTGGINNVELNTYVGMTAALLAVLAVSLLWWRRQGDGAPGRGVVGYFSVAVAIMLGLGWLSASLLDAVNELPIFANNFVGRIRSVLGFSLAVLAGLGLDLLLRRSTPSDALPAEPGKTSGRQWLGRSWFVGMWAALALAVLVVLVSRRLTSPSALWRFLDAHAPLKGPLLIGVVAMAAIVVAWYARRDLVRGTAIALLSGLVLYQGVSFFRATLPANPVEDFYPVTGAHDYLREHLGHDRFDGAGGTMFPTTSLYYGLRAATGHSFLTPEWSELLKTVDIKTQQSMTNYEFPSTLTSDRVGRNPILDRLAVRYFAFAPHQLPGASPLPIDGKGSIPIDEQRPGRLSTTTGPLRGVEVQVARTLAPASDDGMTFEVRVGDGGRQVKGARFFSRPLAVGEVISIPLAGEGLPAASVPIEITVRGSIGPAVLLASGKSIASRAVPPADDGLRLAYSDAGTIILQRLSALPRVRWAGKAQVIPDPVQRISVLNTGVPADEVVLHEAASPGSGRPAQVDVTEDSNGRRTVRVSASGSGYLVVADALTVPGWTATVDGREAPLLRADHAMVAVPVPAGEHTVTLSYDPPWQVAGASTTALGLVTSAGLLLLGRRRPDGSAGLQVAPAATEGQMTP